MKLVMCERMIDTEHRMGLERLELPFVDLLC